MSSEHVILVTKLRAAIQCLLSHDTTGPLLERPAFQYRGDGTAGMVAQVSNLPQTHDAGQGARRTPPTPLSKIICSS